MKNIIIGLASVVILLLAILLVFTTFGRQTRKAELNNGLNNAMQIAIEMLQEDPQYTPKSNEELVADFIQAFSMHIDSSSDIELEILDVDYELGLLSVRATANYKHLTGSDGKVVVEKTIVLEKYEKENAITYSYITYMVDGASYRSYEVKNGDTHILPPTPTIDGKTFAGWQFMNPEGNGAIYTTDQLHSMVVSENVTYIAVFN